VFSGAVEAQLEAILAKQKALSELLESGTVAADKIGKLSRELSQLDRAAVAIREYHGLKDEMRDLQELISSGAAPAPNVHDRSDAALAAAPAEEDELVRMARSELQELLPRMEASEALLLRLLIPQEEADLRDAILELRAGTGGDEAALFAGELMTMYQQFCGARGWGWSPISVSRTDQGGVKEATIGVTGDGAFGRLKYESGVHRVQRVPLTEAGGRVHTSTASVAVLPEAEEVDIDIRAQDLRIDTFRAQGAGGQHVNTTDSAVRITHLPSGVVVQCQDERSQTQNRVKAMRVLRARLLEAEREKKEAARAAARRSQIGRAERSERVRTYNFSQNRVTDHRVNLTKHDMASFMRGSDLDEFIDALHNRDQEEELAFLNSGNAAAV
jgi:peptide chain release factor 1